MPKKLMLRSTLIAALCAVSLAATAFAESPKRIEVPAGDLVTALESFSKQANVNLVYQPDGMQGIKTLGVSGNFTPREAIVKLLEGTPMRLRTDEATGAMLISGPALTDHTKPAANAAQLGALRLAQADSTNNRENSDSGTAKGGFWRRFLRLTQASEASSSSAEQSDQNRKEESGQGGQLEEIVVTAERRAERAQDVPISMSVFSGDFVKQFIGDQFELAHFTPNYQISSQSGTSSPRATMRGLGTSDQFGATSSTSILTYFDGIAASQATGIPQWDLDRLEIQRGPQGTLYGRNAVGGTIQYISAAPTEEFEGYGEFTVGEYDLRRFEGAVSGPITENVKARVSALSYDRGGDITNTFLNKKQGTRDWWGVKGIVDWQISEAFDARVIAQRFEGDEANILFNVAPSNLMPANVQAWFAAIGEDLDLQKESDYKKLRSGHPDPFVTFDQTLVELDLNYDFGPMVLTAIGGYLDAQRVANVDATHIPVPMTHARVPDAGKQWSAEIRLTSQTDHPLQWIAGAYSLHSEDAAFSFAGPNGEDHTGLLRDLDGDGLTRHNANSPEDLFDGLIPALPFSTILSTSSGVRQETETNALFLHTTFDWTDRITTTHAVRYTDEKKTAERRLSALFEYPLSPGVTPGTVAEYFDFINFIKLSHAEKRQQAVTIISDPNTLDANGNIVPQKLSDSWEEVTWRFAADYRLTEDALIYSSISRGFKGGIFAVDLSVDPETSIVYEVGAKTQWWDNRLRVNTSAFYNDHTGFQTQLFTTRPGGNVFVSLIENLPKSELYGGEIEVQAVPFENLLVVANLGFLETEITEVLPGNERLLGHELPFAEDKNFSGLVRYDVHTTLGTFSPQLSGHYRGKFWSTKENDDALAGGQPGDFWTMDARLGYESADRKLYGMFYWKNIFDEVQPILNALPSGVIGTTVSFTNRYERRSWGVTVGYRF